MDDGFTWTKESTFLRSEGEYEGGRFNNTQVVKTKEGESKKACGFFMGGEKWRVMPLKPKHFYW